MVYKRGTFSVKMVCKRVKGVDLRAELFVASYRLHGSLRPTKKHCLISALDLNVYIVMLVMLKWYAKG